jgi:diguanylate cyclase
MSLPSTHRARPLGYPLDDSEAARLEALYSLHILDTPEESRFNEIIRRLAKNHQVPIAALSLVDRHRQWFKASVGLSVQETSRDVAFCAHTVYTDALFLVEDATLDPRFSLNPLVTGEPHIRFYAGAQIRSACGRNVGSLCIIDTKPRTLSAAAAAELLQVANFVSSELIVRQFVESSLRGEPTLVVHGPTAK